MKKLLPTIIAALLSSNLMANPNWPKIEAEAKGQTVYFNAWGGGENINAYIDWAASEAKKKYGVTVKHVKVTDTSDVVKRIKTESAAGRTKDGSVDLLWVNGENFKALKQSQLLFGPWAEGLPNWRYVDLKNLFKWIFLSQPKGLRCRGEPHS